MADQHDHNCMCEVCECTDPCPPTGRGSRPSGGGGGGGKASCTCDVQPCECATPPGGGSPRGRGPTNAIELFSAEEEEDIGAQYQLDEFARAKTYLMEKSKSGVSLYDHLSDVIRKLLDEKSPKDPVDFFEEISMKVKRYRFQPPKDALKDVFFINEGVMNDAKYFTDNWEKFEGWSTEAKNQPPRGDAFVAGGFINLLRLLYYLEQVNLGLPKEEMYRLALSLKDLTTAKPYIKTARFWGKVFGLRKNYYVVEADILPPDAGEGDMWKSSSEEEGEKKSSQKDEGGIPAKKVPSAKDTLEKAGSAVLSSEVLSAYAKTSGLSPEQQATYFPPASEGGETQPPTPPVDAMQAAEFAKWQSYKDELMGGFPEPQHNDHHHHGHHEHEDPHLHDPTPAPLEPFGTGANRRGFYVTNDLNQPWVLLPAVTPAQINASRRTKWALTGELDAKIMAVPNFPGKEGHLLKTLLARASAGSLVSPKGFYRTTAAGEAETDDEEDIDPEEEAMNEPGNDAVHAVKRFRPQMNAVTNLPFWVHHACAILPQGRAAWWNPKGQGDEEEEENSDYDEEEEGMETAPPLFTSVSEDKTQDGKPAWTVQTSTSIFKDSQVVSVRSNTWPGSHGICTAKGKVNNIYFGDAQKFGNHCFSPFFPLKLMKEYHAGPELKEHDDPNVKEEQDFLDHVGAQENKRQSHRVSETEGSEEEEYYDSTDAE